eukprot:6256972-Ditylum_brightwellii.AAC.1
MLEKNPSSHKLHRLWIIVIVEADINMIMKVIWAQRLVLQSESHNYLSRVQFGNRKGRTALDALLLKITTIDSLCLFCLNGGLLNNSAVACYDHMIPAVSSLHLQSLGLPESAVKHSVQFKKKMEHFVRTNAGESTEYYQHTEEYMKDGEGQGKTSSPPNWLFQSSTLLNSSDEQCACLYLTSVDKNYVSEHVAEGYVDDCNAATADQRAQETDTPAIVTE